MLLKEGIDNSKIHLQIEGENKPIASNQYEEGRKKNRRVEITLVLE